VFYTFDNMQEVRSECLSICRIKHTKFIRQKAINRDILTKTLV